MKYQIDGTVVDTDKAKTKWEDNSHPDARSWMHLYLSSRGRYYSVAHSIYDNTPSHAEWITNEDAARWLLLNGHDVPADLEAAAAEISE